MATEKRLIYADALITTIQGTASEVARTSPYEPEWFTRLAQRQFEIIGLIDEAPTVDAVEVVHGRWEFEKNPYMRDVWLYRCTACDGRYCDNPRYCPNCGAKMDRNENP